jgi:lipid A disaccharide synthetase
MSINKEFIDQPLHLIVGAALVIGFSFITSLWMAAIISAVTGLVREIYQRYDEDRAWYDFGPGSRLDLIFWLCRTLWDAVERLKTDIQRIEVCLPSSYSRKDDIQCRFDKIDITLEKIFDKLDTKADK